MDGVEAKAEEGLDYRSRQIASVLAELASADGTLNIDEVKKAIKKKRHAEHNPMRQLRKDLNLTQEKAAGLCSVSKLTVSNYESGKCSPQLDRLIKYASALLCCSATYHNAAGEDALLPKGEVVSLVADYTQWYMESEGL